MTADSQNGRVGGIIGRNVRGDRPEWALLTDSYNVAIQNCYAVTNRIGAIGISGGLVGYLEYAVWYWDFSNSYFNVSGNVENDGAVGTWYNNKSATMNPNKQTKEWIKENIGKTTLNSYYKPDEFNKNDGFPVLNWEYKKWK